MTEVTLRSDIQVDYIDHMGDDAAIAQAARVSLANDLREYSQANDEGLIRYLAREGHTSPFEHTALKIRFEAPIFVHRQAMTHRTLSKNTESGRYTELESGYWVPENDRPLINAGSGAHPDMVQQKHHTTHPLVVSELKDVYTLAQTSYDYMTSGDKVLDDVIANEVARAAQPVGTYTSWYMTGNLFAWLQFLDKRDGSDGHPQHEIMDLANQVWPIVEQIWPVAAKAWRERYKGKTRKLVEEYLQAYPPTPGEAAAFEQFIRWAEERNK